MGMTKSEKPKQKISVRLGEENISFMYDNCLKAPEFTFSVLVEIWLAEYILFKTDLINTLDEFDIVRPFILTLINEYKMTDLFLNKRKKNGKPKKVVSMKLDYNLYFTIKAIATNDDSITLSDIIESVIYFKNIENSLMDHWHHYSAKTKKELKEKYNSALPEFFAKRTT
ncbi:MAG: hypothetical protein OEZ36_07615 [Spirochaetota bacterium]|nr:hypothetical protein [Spirochaetota bacterium]